MLPSENQIITQASSRTFLLWEISQHMNANANIKNGTTLINILQIKSKK